MSLPVRFRVYLVRHGETEWNKTRRIQGQLDVPLNESGRRQAMLVAESLKDISFARAFSSDLQRAYDTAESIIQYHPDTPLTLDEAVRERYMGELQGEFGRDKPAPSLETSPNLIARCLGWYSDVIVDYMVSVLERGTSSEQTHNILVVSHGAWILTLLSALKTNGELAFREGVDLGPCGNTGVSIIEYEVLPSGNRLLLLGTLVQFSGVQHLVHANVHVQESNADILEDVGGSA